MTALPMTGFHRAQISLHGKQYFRNTATFGILPSPLHSMIHRLQTERRDSFRVRDSHPIPLFSEQACVSDCSGRAFATKAMLFSLLYVRLILRTQKDLSCPAISQAKEVSYSLYIRFDCTQKIPSYTVGCKNCANYLHFYIHLPLLRTFPFQNLHSYLTANRSHCKGVKFLEGLGGFLGVLGFCSRLSNFVGIRRKFLWCNFQYMYCIYFHIMLLSVYRFCMSAMAISLFLF